MKFSLTQFALLAVISLIASDLFAQSNSEIRIHIERDDNGDIFELDTAFNTGEGMDVQQLLQSFGIEGDMLFGEDNEDVEIIINKTKTMEGELETFKFEFNELMEEMRDQVHVFRAPEVESNRAFLGVYYDGDYSEEENVWSAHVTSVIEGTGAEAGGIQKGDEIVSIQGVRFSGDNNIHDVLQAHNPGDEVSIGLIREGNPMDIRVTLGTPKEDKEFLWLGDDNERMHFHWDEGDMDELRFYEEALGDFSEESPFLGVYLDLEENGALLISGTAEGSTAERMGLAHGDKLTAVNGIPTPDYETLKDVISGLEVGQDVSVNYIREGNSQSATGTLGSKHNSFNHEGLKLKEGLERCLGDVEDILHGELELLENGELSLELLEDLVELRELEDLNIFFSDDEFDGEESRVIRRVAVFITMDNISEEEANQINESSENKISTENNLPIEAVYFSPNPNDGRFNLNFELIEQGDAMLRIYDIGGRQVFESFVGQAPGSYNQLIDITDEPKGIYFMQISQNGKNFSKKVVIQ